VYVAEDGGFIPRKGRVSLAKSHGEGVSSNLHCRIKNKRHRLDYGFIKMVCAIGRRSRDIRHKFNEVLISYGSSDHHPTTLIYPPRRHHHFISQPSIPRWTTRGLLLPDTDRAAAQQSSAVE
jgi:hypothetical protein